MPLADHVSALWNAAEREIGGGLDHTAIGLYLDQLD
jgi:hypothetical protein